MADYALQVSLDQKDLTVSTAVGAATFPLVLGLAQSTVFRPLGVTCARGVVPSLLGGASICLAGGVASLTVATANSWSHVQGSPGDKSQSRTVALTPSDLLVSTVSSVLIFRALGGRFTSVLPSSLLRPGAFAREWLPAKGPDYATQGQKNLIQAYGRKYGCHSCGKRWPSHFVADHQPPSSTLKNSLTQQFFFPQCPRCSNIQGSFVGGSGSKFIRTHPFSLRLYHLFLPVPLILAHIKSQSSNEEAQSSVGAKAVTGSLKDLTREVASQTPGEDGRELERKRPTDLRAILNDSDLSNLVANFPALIIWQRLMAFLNSFHPVDAFHLTLWGFAVVAAFGTI